MSFSAEVLRVFIASPSDVSAERNEITNAIFEWNHSFAETLNVVLLPARWERDVVPAYRGSDPQQIINEQITSKCDIVIGVFWSKLGTPTEGFVSGTLEEIDLFIKSGKEVLVYFVDKPVPRSGINYDELRRVDEYKAEYQQKGIYAKYDSLSIKEHLYKKVLDYKKKVGDERQQNDVGVEPGAVETKKASELMTVPVFHSNPEVVKVKEFWESRVSEIEKGNTVVPLVEDLTTYLSVHVVPHNNYSLSIKDMDQTVVKLRPLYTTGWDHLINIDGLMTYAKWPNYNHPHSYVQFYKSGGIESVDNGLLRSVDSRKKIPVYKLQRDIIDRVFYYLTAQKDVGVEAPVSVFISLVNIKGYTLAISPDFFNHNFAEVYNRDNLHLPEVVISDMAVSQDELYQMFRSSFDTLWNAFGFAQSRYEN
ncbi:DUF4062 domain-containing protein [Paenibacillus sp. JNUCC32]|uniref:DUF4062 domain-containing protein n=1 Tax=Paenibacillus sp. JNUCC32 TaxID=2777984 RepID=UPI0017878C18|nr:DUF4062 domain-containing protein [Paenibacillus sp. JNUCC-32]QOT12938.1 DUF4062 domain-containing protein [Paenibacillus sp. JNUCC-32]